MNGENWLNGEGNNELRSKVNGGNTINSGNEMNGEDLVIVEIWWIYKMTKLSKINGEK